MSPLFSDAERDTLDYAAELARDRKMSPETFAALQIHFSERETCDLAWIVAGEHLCNLTNIELGISSDSLCGLSLERKKINSADR